MDASESCASITLLYVRPACDEETELDRRVGVIAERYAEWVELRVVCPEDLTWPQEGSQESRDVERMVESGSPTLFLLRAGAIISEAVGALLPARELDRAVRRAVEWPIPAPLPGAA